MTEGRRSANNPVIRAVLLAALVALFPWPAGASETDPQPGDVRLVKAICFDEESLVTVSDMSITDYDKAGEIWVDLVKARRCGVARGPFPVKLLRRIGRFVDAVDDIVETWEVTAPDGRTVYANFLMGHAEAS